MSRIEDERLLAEYRELQSDTIRTLQQEVRRLSDDILIFKTKLGMIAVIIGGLSGLATALLVKMVSS